MTMYAQVRLMDRRDKKDVWIYVSYKDFEKLYEPIEVTFLGELGWPTYLNRSARRKVAPVNLRPIETLVKLQIVN